MRILAGFADLKKANVHDTPKRPISKVIGILESKDLSGCGSVVPFSSSGR